jgi:hypothetical protein
MNRMKTIQVCIAALVLGACGFAFADTVTLKDGTIIDGIVTKPNQDTVVIQVGTVKVTIAAVAVAGIEANDKKGNTAAPGQGEAAKKLEDPLYVRTGLTREQREAVRDELDKLWSPDEADRSVGRKRLEELAKQMPVFQFIDRLKDEIATAMEPEEAGPDLGR